MLFLTIYDCIYVIYNVVKQQGYLNKSYIMLMTMDKAGWIIFYALL